MIEKGFVVLFESISSKGILEYLYGPESYAIALQSKVTRNVEKESGNPLPISWKHFFPVLFILLIGSVMGLIGLVYEWFKLESRKVSNDSHPAIGFSIRNQKKNQEIIPRMVTSIEMTEEEIKEEKASRNTRKYSESHHEVTCYELNGSILHNLTKANLSSSDTNLQNNRKNVAQIHFKPRKDVPIEQKRVMISDPCKDKSVITHGGCHTSIVNESVPRRKSIGLNRKVDKFGRVWRGVNVGNKSCRVKPVESMSSNSILKSRANQVPKNRRFKTCNKISGIEDFGWERAKHNTTKYTK